ncbi:MAG: hypothetical protein HC938_17300 [Nitrospira sp.]|nr:hypothetical protein [Nitrospira sp.]
MIHNKMLYRGIVLIALLGASSLHAGPIDSPGHPHEDKAQLVHEANHEVDQAWEVYHEPRWGNSGLTCVFRRKSSNICTKARTLVTQAQEAAERGDDRQVEELCKQVRLHTTQAIKGSKEQKK